MSGIRTTPPGTLFDAEERWAKRLARVLRDVPPNIEVLVTQGNSLVCVKGTHSRAMEAVGVPGENAEIEAGTITTVSNGPLRPYGESL